MQQLVAIVYTDIAGYSAIAEKSEAEGITVKSRHRDVIEAGLRHFRGTLHELVGDGSLSFFPSVSDAVECAISWQASFRQMPYVPVRIGIHLGEIKGQDQLVYGHALNVGSRIESIGEAGSILVSGHVVDSVSGKAHYGFESLGSFSFKNVEKPIEIYAVAADGLHIPDMELVAGKFKQLERRDVIVFDEWDDQELTKRMLTAQMICQQAVCSYGFINYNFTKLRAFLARGGIFRCVMIHPESNALIVSPERQAGAASDIRYVQGQLQLAFQKLKGLPNGVEFHLTQHLPDPIMTFVDPDTDNGVLFITLTGFRMDLHDRPSFVLRKTLHRKWFDFYYTSFRRLLESGETKCVDLSQPVFSDAVMHLL